MTTHSRRTSQYALTVPAPEHTDADLNAASRALAAATTAQGLIVTGAWSTDRATLSVSYRAADDDTALALAHGILAAYGTDPADAHMHTGYGISRRDFPVTA